MKIVVTGASGFVGRYVCSRLIRDGHEVRAVVRRANSAPRHTREFTVGDLGSDVDWDSALTGADAVIHLAARVHVMEETARDPLSEFRRINVNAAVNLAECAEKRGIQRFVNMSSIKVNGERTTSVPFKASSFPQPSGPYSLSKWEAEQQLAELSARSNMSVISVRAPMVYGPGVGGNMARLTRLAKSGWPVPLGSARNKRTLVSVQNLADLLTLCATSPGLSSGLVLAGDAHSPSTRELYCELARAFGRTPRLLNVPVPLMSLLGGLLNKRDDISRLMDSLEIETSTTVENFRWTPPLSFSDGIRLLALEAQRGVAA